MIWNSQTHNSRLTSFACTSDHADPDEKGRVQNKNGTVGLWGEAIKSGTLPTPPGMAWAEYKAILLSKDSDISSAEPLPSGWNWDEYHDNEEVQMFLEFLSREYSNVATTFSIGNSGQRKPMTAIKVSRTFLLFRNLSPEACIFPEVLTEWACLSSDWPK